MKLITERGMIREVAEKWRKQYPDESKNPKCEFGAIYKKLAALDPETASAKDIERIIGNDTWTRPSRCSECGYDSFPMLEVGEEPNWESRTAYLCASCVRKAADLIA